ncbi:hypothetical protein L7F22_018227 [Adiantum nelumboides]|nr:hypothetical protein [Adiantum nelumboides]
MLEDEHEKVCLQQAVPSLLISFKRLYSCGSDTIQQSAAFLAGRSLRRTEGVRMGIENLGSRRGSHYYERSDRRTRPYRSSAGGRIRKTPRLPVDVCNNCHRSGHFARDCPNPALCNKCGLPGHIASVCTNDPICWNCKEPGHNAKGCPNETVCILCNKPGHLAKNCNAKEGDSRLCRNCQRPGHLAADCKNEKACNNCRKPGHLARECKNNPVCNVCNQVGHMARDCERSVPRRRASSPLPVREPLVCRNCRQVGHRARDCLIALICDNCGGRGHKAVECPSDPMVLRGMRYC